LEAAELQRQMSLISAIIAQTSQGTGRISSS
jgi:hypothetical protein